MDKIKYHQNGVEPKYDENHQLADNWDPDKDYGNEYVEVHFRIDTKGYEYPDFEFKEEDKMLFQKEITKSFTDIGWEDRMPYFENGKSYLYVHPKDISGEILKTDVKTVAEALQGKTTFQLQLVDLYSTVYDITDEEYQKYLHSKEPDVRTLIFEKCKTKRKTKFFYATDKQRQIAEKIRLKRVHPYQIPSDDLQAIEYVKHIMDEMVDEGLLIREYVKNGVESEYIRSLNVMEMTEREKLARG